MVESLADALQQRACRFGMPQAEMLAVAELLKSATLVNPNSKMYSVSENSLSYRYEPSLLRIDQRSM